MKKNKSIFMLIVMLMSIGTQFITSLGTIKTFAESLGVNIIDKDSSNLLGKDKNGNKTILTDVQMMVVNENNTVEEMTESRPIKVGEKFEIHYTFRIPDELGKEVESGDYFEFDLPKSDDIQLTSSKEGELIDPDDYTNYGTYRASKDGHVIMTFNDNVKKHNDVDGNLAFSVYFEEKTIHIPGGHEIEIPYVTKDEGTFIYLAGKIDSYIQKEYLGANSFIYRWKILMNPKYQLMTKLSLIENAKELGGGNTVAESINIEKMVRADVDLSGNITEHEEVEIKNKTFNPDGSIDLGIDSINQPYVMYINTPFPYGIKNTVENNILLSAYIGTEHIMENASAQSIGDSQIAISKKVVSYDKENQIVEWETTFNPNSYYIKESDAHFRDEITNGYLTEDPMEVKPNLDHTVDIASNRESFDFYFKTDVNKPVTIKYKTKIKDTKQALIKNKVITGEQVVDVPQSIENNGGGENGNGTSTITKKTPRPAPDGANWELNFNSERQKVDKWWVTDQLDSGSIIKNTLAVTNVTTKQKLTPGRDYELEWIPSPKNQNEAIGFTVRYNESTSDEFKIEYRTITERNTIQRNHAYYHYLVSGTEKEDEDSQNYNPPTMEEISLAKSGVYIPDSREIEWTVNLNERAKVSIGKNNVLKDIIEKDQIFQRNSVKVEYRDGAVWNSIPQAIINFNESSNELEVTNLKTSSNAQRLIFRTKLEEDIDILNKTIENTATYSDEYTPGISAKAELTIDNANNYLAKKSGKQNVINSDLVDWEVVINPYSYKLNNLVILDDSWENQTVIRESIKLYDTVTSRNLIEGIDYDLDYTERYFKISMKNQVEHKLLLTYQGRLLFPFGTALGSQQETKNSIKITADRVIKNDKPIDVTIPVKVSDSSGIVQGKVKGLRVKKVSADDPNKTLSGAEFTLYRGSEIDKNKVVQKSTTDNQGYAYFDKLTKGDYLLVETKSPTGYVISNEMKKGRIIQVTDDETTSIEETVKNPTTNVEEKLIDFPVQKEWRKVPLGVVTPEVKITLYADNDSNEIQKMILNENNEYKGVFKDLPEEKDGKKIHYYIKEEKIPNYDSSISGGEITNTYNNTEKTNVKGKKEWDDDNDKASKRPDRVKIELYQNDKYHSYTYAYKTDNWIFEFDNLPKVNNETGLEYTYTVKESDIPEGYESSVNGTVIKNTFKEAETTSLSGRKIWDDNEDAVGQRPHSVRVELQQDGKYFDEQEVTATQNWEYRFDELPKINKATNEVYQYTVVEKNIPDGYESSIEGNNIRNIYTKVEIISVSGKKEWKDNGDLAGKRPDSVKINLLQNNRYLADTEVSESTNWEYRFGDLPKRDSKGNLYHYSVEEENVPNGYTSSVSGTIITNTFTEKPVELIEVEGEKKWNDDNNKDKKRPANITVFLMRNDNSVKPYDTQIVSAGNDGKWTYKFRNLPKYDESGREYKYSIKESPVKDYNTQNTGAYDLLNTYIKPSTTTIKGKKVWRDEDDIDGKRPSSVTIQLLQNNRPYKTTEAKPNNWEYSFNDVPIYDNNGDVYNYTVEEVGIPEGYTSTVSGTTVTNVYHPVPKETITIEGDKNWDDYNGNMNTRPNFVDVELYRNDNPNKPYEVQRIYNNGKGTWPYKFVDLPKYESAGKEYVYTIKEAAVPNYISSGFRNYDLLNTLHLRAKTKVTGEKIWDDEDNVDGIRPKSVTVRLLANGVEVPGEVREVSAKTDWKFTFDNLEMYDNRSKVIEYTVKEDNVEGYVDYHTNDSNHVTIRNKHKVIPIEKISIEGEKKWEDQSNGFGKRPDNIIVDLYRDGELEESAEVSESTYWKYEFTDLLKYKGTTKEEYKYVVKEREVPKGYESSVNGYDITNKYLNNDVTQVTGEKIWDDYDNKFETRPQKITVKLYKNDEYLEEQEVSEATEWKYKFTNLPVYDDHANLNIYKVEEHNIPNGYISKITNNNITNTYRKTETTEVSGEKLWNDYGNAFNTRPNSIIVELYDGNKQVGKQEVKADTAGNWEYKFTDLPKYDEQGNEIEYTLKEIPVKDYTQIIEGNNIYNTYVNNETTHISVKKEWDDKGFTDIRPKSIEVILYGNDELERVELSEINDWSHTFSDLPMYDNTGKKIQYSVVEEGIDHYITTYETVDNVTGTKVIITNELNDERTTNLSGKKIWDDLNNSFKLRPNEVEVVLQQDGVDMPGKEQIVNKDTAWGYSFTDLPITNNNTGKPYIYTVREKEVPEYTTSYEGTNIKNTYRNTEKVSLKGKKIWIDYDNKFKTRPDKLDLILLRDGSKFKEIVVDKENDYQFEFLELPKYADDAHEYKYEVIEKSNDSYEFTSVSEQKGNEIFVTLTNTYRNTETISIEGKKYWDDYNNKFKTRPANVTIQLIRSSQSVKKEVVANQVITADDEWYYQFNNLPRYDDKGDEYNYEIKEAVIETEPKYSSEVVGNDIINHYVKEDKVNFSGEKIWDDYDNKFDTRPKSGEVTIYLYSGDSKIDETKTDSTKDWKYEFNKGYPVYDVVGEKIEYSIKEEKVPNYSTTITETSESSDLIKDHIITNKYVNTEKTSLFVSKTWDDFDDKFKLRPTELKVTLHPTNEIIILSETNDWEHEFNDLLVYDEKGNEITYWVEEEKVPNYRPTHEEGTSNFVNRVTELDAKTSISGNKIWKDEDNKLGKRPTSITVALIQNGLPMLDSNEQPITQEVSVLDGWRYQFFDLPKYDEHGILYIYSVEELKVDHYESVVANDQIINTYINNETIDVSGEKTWLDLDNKLNTRPKSITVKLYQSGLTTPYDQQVVIPDEQGHWKYNFTNLPKYDDNLNEYEYRVDEEVIDHYQTSVDGYNLINTYKNDQVTEIDGEKLWLDLDNKLNTRPEFITVELYQNDDTKPFETKKVMANEEGDWRYSFTNLPKYDDNYDLFNYTVKETPTPHYETSIYEGSETTIYNHYINDDKTNVKVIKNWEDQGNKLNTRPNSIRVNLYRNHGLLPYKTQTILPNENGLWSYEFKDLPKYDNNLELYEYTVKEMKVPDYSTSVVDDQTNNVSMITNTYKNTEKTEVNGFKAWLDHDNKLNSRPESITVELYQSGKDTIYQTQEVTPNGDGYWYYSFKDLPKYDEDLNLYTYTVKEKPVEHYESHVSDTNIINSYQNNDVIKLTGEKIWNDLDDKLNTRPDSIKVELYQGNRLYETKDVVPGQDGKWLYEFSDLPKYNANLDEYIYTVREPKIPGYQTEINDTLITNHYQNSETVNVPVKKVWNDQNNKLNTRPSMIKVELYQNDGKEPLKTETLLPNTTNEWSYEFLNLPKYDENLDEYVYTVKEQPVEGYESTIDGTTITNTYKNNQLIGIKGEKEWNDFDDKLGLRPEKIYVDLYQNDGEKSIATQMVEADKKGHWEYEFINLPKYDDELNEYRYSVKEKKVPHYDSEVVGSTIRNQYRNDDIVELSGKKIWNDLDNKLNTRPKAITIDLYQNDSTVPMKSKKVEADAKGEWNYTFKDLPKYDNELNEYHYSVKEHPVKGYETSVEGTTISNTYQNSEKTSISGKKVWKDEDNILNNRPESIIVQLHQNGSKDVIDEKEIMVNSDGVWEYSFTDLPKYDDQLEEYIYTVTEQQVPHYETTIDKTTITNTYINDEKVKVEGQKIWKDEDNKLNTRPKTIKIDLYQNEGKKAYKTETIQADEDGNWKYVFADLPKYDEHLVAYRYTVKEQPVPNYDSTVIGTNIENTYQNVENISISGEKTWSDLDNKLGTRPTEIFVELYQTTKENPEVVNGQSPFKMQKVEPDKNGNWQYEFTNLPKYDSKLDEYNYLVKEHTVKDYSSEVNGTNIKNSYQNKETIKVEGKKIWKKDLDNKLESRPESIIVNLYQNDSQEIYKSQTVIPNKEGDWNYSFKDLPKYDSDLNEYKYTVKENPVSHYESKVDGTTITNTYQNTDVTQIKGKKQWNDEGDKLKKRPESITVELYKNKEKQPYATQIVTSEDNDNWNFEFNNLPKYDKDLNEYEYTVKEHEVEDYTTTIEGTTIVNTYKNVKTTQVKGEKKWEDFDNKLNVRPNVITVDLYQNGTKEAYRSQLVVPDQEGHWNYSFENLPKYDEKLNEYTYTVKEQKVDHYLGKVVGNDIVNTYDNTEKITVDGKKIWKDFDNKLQTRPETITVELYQNNGEKPFRTQEVSAGSDNSWSYSFKDLPKYDSELNEYTYIVKEQKVPNYDTTIKGTTITNTYLNKESIKLNGEKKWDDFNDKLKERPEVIIVELYQNDNLEPYKTEKVIAGKDNKWLYEFSDLPKYDEELNEYVYTIKEQTVLHYNSEIAGTTITNKYRNDDVVEIKGKKVWRDFENKLKERPNTITVELYQNNGEKPFRTQNVKAGIDKQWRYTFKDLPKYDSELNEYIYTIKEIDVPHYDTEIDNTTITNTYRNDDLTKVVGEKVWKDFDNKLNSRPKNITIELYQNDNQKPFKKQIIEADDNNNWRYSFDNLPKYDEELNEYAYTVKEVDVPHYDTEIDNTTITNTYRNDDVTKISGKKVWEDLDNKLNSRPKEITIELYRNNGKKPIDTQVVKADENGDWYYSFDNLPKYDKELDEYIYTVKESEVPRYEADIVGTTITNTYRNDDMTELNGEKLWDDQDDKLHLRPKEITIHLYQNDVLFKSQNISADKEGNWNYSFKELPRYDNNLDEYHYTVKEQTIPLYSSEVVGTTITNTFRNDQLIKLSGKKIWNDSDNKLEVRPKSIFVELYRGKTAKPYRIQQVKADKNGNWDYTFEDLPKYDPKLNEYVYSIKEHGVPHYDSSIEGTTIVNTYRNDDKTELSGEKRWEDFDNKLNSRPDSIKVDLYQNNDEKPFATQEVIPDGEGKWSYQFSDLPKYNDNLNEHVYTVKEQPVKNYDSKVEGNSIINTYRNDDTVKVEGEKYWKDSDNKLNSRPNGITVELYQNDNEKPYDEQIVSSDEAGNWYYLFDNLPKYDDQLNEYTYTVKEVDVAHYESEVIGTTIINTYKNDEKTELKGQKIWQDNDNEAKLRPDSIIVEVYQNDEKTAYKTQKVKPDTSGNWNFIFEDLPKYDDKLEEYVYTLKELEVKGYQSEIIGTTITNTLINDDNPVTPKNPKDHYLPKTGRKDGFLPKTGDSGEQFFASLLGITLLSITSVGLYFRRKKS